ncbi:efflux RND transporter periplasmic adaptor subunit [Microbulbifer sp. 2205BS26-8]|uniref:efflux RND transporter periplasmic adaptor subunit n=1 Tax=Microbulbifer sp. 2205BS26-8 TaxID=3064386 RepID=UPI00273F1A8A|nr:efflux RND transporter periplasmic adaptor subunit [Microbulbifer sp. 2205BS26-8]MDP5210268.1 efflux RND transporter periplasmic adaptor subunit [Microbulbifer sp. 2205BS26-8]
MGLMLLGCLVLFGGIFAFKFFGWYMMNQFLDTMPLPAATVTSTTATIQSWREDLSGVGTVRAINGVEVTTEAEGVVSAIHFKSGQYAHKGDLLAEIFAEPEKAQLQVLDAELRLARRNFARIDTLTKRGVTTEADLDSARSTLDQVVANIEVQRARVDQRRVVAPFSGVLGIRRIDLGQNVSPGEAVVSLQQLDPIFVDFSLPEQAYSMVKPGIAVVLTTDAFPGNTYHGKITAVDPQVDNTTRNFLIQATLNNPKKHLRPGMFAQVAVLVDASRQVLVVPRTALVFASYGVSVFVLEKDAQSGEMVANKRFVKTGEERGDLVEIVQGLLQGDVVASSGLLKLRNGGPAIINNENKPPDNPDPKPDNS